MPNPAQKCGNCFFMMPQDQNRGGVIVSVPCCRFEAPMPTVSPCMPAIWPNVDPEKDWCGHWVVQQ